MPIIEKSGYHRAPFWQRGGHLQTLVPGIFRKVTLTTPYQRERITLSDGDFLDLDWLRTSSKKLVILTHGLEGNSSRQYVIGMARHFSNHGWDALAWHCRSCSGEMNRAFKLYHHGDIGDISEVIDHAIKKGGYESIALVGFSLGANISLKYMGVRGDKVPEQVCACVAFSGPCDLESASIKLDAPGNVIYRKRFYNALSKKLTIKAEQFPGRLDPSLFSKIKVWRDFDEWFSAPICGYKNADEFYYQSSSKNFVEGIRIPSILINAANDPILTPACMPWKESKNHPFFHFEMPKKGGHCGFMTPGREMAWSELRALEFCEAALYQY